MEKIDVRLQVSVAQLEGLLSCLANPVLKGPRRDLETGLDQLRDLEQQLQAALTEARSAEPRREAHEG